MCDCVVMRDEAKRGIAALVFWNPKLLTGTVGPVDSPMTANLVCSSSCPLNHSGAIISATRVSIVFFIGMFLRFPYVEIQRPLFVWHQERLLV